MKILTGEYIAKADRYTIENEPVSSINLMERAAEIIAQWICNNIPQEQPLSFFIGKGNNGGDGLAVARMLYNVGYNCTVYLIYDKKVMSEDCRYNLSRLPRGINVGKLDNVAIAENEVIIDALLGSGIKGDVSDELGGVIDMINDLGCRVISIDLPSGMLTENSFGARKCVMAETTLTIQFPKLSMLLPESGESAGNIVVLDIALSEEYIASINSGLYYVDSEVVSKVILPRTKFGYKGNFGHALLVCGSEGMMGAAVLATGSALRSGCGLVTACVPKDERSIIHTTNSSAIVISDLQCDTSKYNTVGIGCGLGTSNDAVNKLKQLFKACRPMVIDADALNILALNRELISDIPQGSVLTPHIGELKCLIGEWNSDSERNEKVIALSRELSVVIVVKGAHTMVCSRAGELYFNSTGSSAMAKGGSGDVLTGYITGLMSRGYSAEHASIIGIYIHGTAGDKAADYFGSEGMNSSDIIDFLGEAMAEIS